MESEEVKNILLLQEILLTIDIKNIDEKLRIITDSDFMKTEIGVNFIVNETLKIIKVRPMQYFIYSELLKKIYDKRSEKNRFELIPKFLKNVETSSIFFRFYRGCIVNGLVTIDNLIQNIPETYSEDKVFTFFFFADLIKINNESMYNRFKDIILTRKISGIKDFNQCSHTCLIEKIIKNFLDYEKDDFQLLLQYIMYGWPVDSIQFHMIIDDVDFLMNYADNNIFDFNLVAQRGAIDTNKFALSYTEDATLVEFCAFYGAVNCVKYLINNKAKLRNKSMGFAFAGGNAEIIRIFQSKGLVYKSGMLNAIKFRRNDLFLLAYSFSEQRQVKYNKVFSDAVRFNNMQLILKLLENSVDCNGKNIAESLINFHSLDLVKLFQSLGCNFRSIKCVMAAAKNGDAKILKYLLENHSDFEEKEGTEFIPLIEAAKSQDYDTVQLLIDYGADPNAFNETQSAFHVACSLTNSLIVELLILEGAFVNLPNKSGETPIVIAAHKGHINIIKLLMDHGAEFDVNPTTEIYSPLTAAAEGGHLEVVKYLIANGCDPNESDGSEQLPLKLAMRARRTEVTKFLINLIKGDLKIKVSLLFTAVKQKDLNWIQVLIQNNTPLNETDPFKRTVMHYAASTNAEIINYLHSCGATVNPRDEDEMTPLHMAIYKENVECVSALLGCGANVDMLTNKGYSMLRIAVQSINFEIVQLLLDNNADPNVEDFNGITPLIGITGAPKSPERIEMMTLLLNSGADTRMVESSGQSAFRILLHHDPTIEEINLLRNFKSPINGQSRNGIQAIFEAAHLEPTIFKHIVSIGGNIRLGNRNGDTALHGAAETSYIENARFLIDQGFSPNIRNRRQRTPIFNAIWFKSASMVDFLISKGAKINAVDDEGSNALICAMKSERPPPLSFIKFLVSRKLNIKKKNKKNETVKYIAEHLGYSQIYMYINSL